ncbi:MAG: restriction endonuclease [Clostridiales bacterium]|nr:restriction endonuclease [Clostridiales bacterium]
MASKEFFPQRPKGMPMIYAYSDKNYPGLLKIGHTTIDVKTRVEQQYPIILPTKKPYKIVFAEPAIRNDGTSFMDHKIHERMRKLGIENPDGEWFKSSIDDLKASYIAVRDRTENIESRTEDFQMRPEQKDAVEKTILFYRDAKKEYPDRAPKFLWNAKMRFGKTFASYQLAKRMKFKKILVLTFKPAVESAWEEDLMTHIDFEGWQFISKKNGYRIDDLEESRPIVCFGSFQDLLGVDRETGGIKAKNEWVHTTNWDIVIFDEYHFGAWRDSAQKLFLKEDEDEYDALDIEKYKEDEADNAYNETFLPITTSYYLFLSGTPFRAINSGEFIEDQIFNWTYSDEQNAKEEWGDKADNPYAALPRMVMMTYRMPEDIRNIAIQGEFNEFDLNVFFSAEGTGDKAKFIHENEVQKWLDLIRGAHLPSSIDDLKLGRDKRPPMPYSDVRLLSVLTHTLWFMPSVASAYAMKNLLKKEQNTFYHDYTINVAAGSQAGIGLDALAPVERSMGNPLESKTITLSCGKLTTGVTIRPWTGIFMLRNLSSPETYFQAAFRVQSPWVIDGEDGKKEIIKEECYVFDFALDRALKQIADYSTRLNINESDPEKKVDEFIKFLPVLAYDGSSMKEINASEVLDIAMAGTSATLLAKRWESALLVNVDNDTLTRLMANEEALNALMSIEGFRNLNNDITTIINKSGAVKKVRKKGGKLSVKEKRELTKEEKEYKSKRKEIQEKLIKFATRIPIFMYLTDFREKSLKDVITKLEPGLFKKVTGLNVKDFELLVSLGVFNGPLMNDAVYKFKRYEDASLEYTGINRHEGLDIGLWDTVISANDYEEMFRMQQASLDGLSRRPNNVEAEVKGSRGRKESEAKATKKVKTTIKKGKKPVIYETREEKQEYNYTQKEESQAKGDKEIDYKKLIILGTTVGHEKFGNGQVIMVDQKNKRISVRFKVGEKLFVFPEAFEKGFLDII